MKGLLAFFGCLGSILGCAASIYFKKPEFVGIVVISAFCLIFAFKKGAKTAGLFLGTMLLAIVATSFRAPIDENESVEYNGVIIEKKENYYIFLSSMTRFYVYDKGSTREVGDWVSIQGKASKVSIITYESQFDFGDYLHKKGVDYDLVPEEVNVIFNRPLRLEARKKEFLSGFDDETRSLLDAICFSHLDYSSPIVANSASLSLLFVISGGGFIYGGLLFALEKLLRKKLKEASAKSITMAFAFILLLPLGMRAGIYRVFTVRLIDLVSILRKKRNTRFQTLSYAAFIMILLNPYYALDQGYLIGFGCSFASYFTSEWLGRKKKFRKKTYETAIRLSMIFPLAATNYEYHIMIFIYVAVLSPLVMVYSLMGYGAFIGIPLTNSLVGFTSFLSKVIQFMRTIDLVLPLGLNGFYQVFAYYGILALTFYLREIGFVQQAKITISVLFVSIALVSLPIGNGASQEVSFINVGQGDAILIRDGYHAAMIDTGGLKNIDIATEVDIPFLKKRRVRKLDFLVASHGDFDHIGGKNSLMQNFSVGKFIDYNSTFPIKLGTIDLYNLNIYSWSEENDKSLVIKATIMNKVFLFTGDASSKVEEKILAYNPDLKVDVLKVGHHGSKTSSSMAFLSSIKPDVAVISCGKNNRYGHPDPDVLHRFESLGTKIYRTDQNGTITFKKYFFQKTINLNDMRFVYNNHINDYSYLFRAAENG